MSQSNITVHIAQEHTCGHMHESVYHMKEANVDISHQWPKLPNLAELTAARGKPFQFHIEVEPERKLEFSGGYDKVEFKGVIWKDKQVLCEGCGVSVLVGEFGGEPALIAKEREQE
jgi:hypothetical protein